MGKGRTNFWGRAGIALLLAAALAACGRGPVASAPVPPVAEPPLIARADLFGEPDRQQAQLSPRGDRVAYLALRDGVTNLWVVPVDAASPAQPLTNDRDRGVRAYAWAYDNATLLYLLDQEGEDNWRLHAVSAGGGEPRALTPAGGRAELLGLSPNDPDGAVVTLNQRDPAWPDLFRIDIATGARTLVQRNLNRVANRGFASFVVDRSNRLRLGLKMLADGGAEVFARSLEGVWSSLFTIPFEDTRVSRPLAFEADGRTFLMLDSTGRDRAALVRVDTETGAKTVLGESERADVVDVWLDPASNAPEAFAAEYLRRDWRALEPEAQADLDFLDQQLDGDPSVVSRSLDDARWIVVEAGPSTPARSYLYDRADPANRRLTLLFRHRPGLEQAPLQPMAPVEIEARDGLTLVSYLTLPIGADANADTRPDAPVPLVLTPHRGPWERDSYGYDPLHQWLANRGYGALSVNFRGSAGFGKAFLNAGNGEWGARMQEDLLDAAQWAVENGIAQPDRVAIFGGAYGGYAALAGLAFTPDRFRCGVSFAGPANLAAMADSLPAHWSAYRDELYLRIGDPRTPEGRQALRERSPITRAGQIARPLLLAAGGLDPYGARAQADGIAANLRARGVGLVYLVYPDEGRELVRPSNRLSFYAVAEHFLRGCLGGRAEPAGPAFDGARLEAFDGAASVPGLSAFARRPPVAAPAEAAGITPAPAVELDAKPAPPEAAPAEPPAPQTFSPAP